MPLPVMADATYYYTGEDFQTAIGEYTTSDSISGWFTVGSPLPDNLNDAGDLAEITPTAFSFSDGMQTITNMNASSSEFGFFTDGSGDILSWNFGVFQTFGNRTTGKITSEDIFGGFEIDSVFYPLGNIDPGDNYGLNYIPGTWSGPPPSTTPEPSTLVLLLTGLAGVAYRKFSRA
jgi:hypothetical protein